MQKNETLEKLDDFLEKFTIFYQQRRQTKELMRFVNATSFKWEAFLLLIEQSLKERFLVVEEARFLEFMVKKTGLDKIKYSSWRHKEEKITRLVIDNQIYMDFEKIQDKLPIDIPLNILFNNAKQSNLTL